VAFKGGTRGAKFFRRIIRSYIWRRTTKFDGNTRWGRGVFLAVSHMHIPRAAGPSVLNFGGLLHNPHTIWQTTTKLCMVIKPDACPRPKIFVTRMLTRDLFAVSNLLVYKLYRRPDDDRSIRTAAAVRWSRFVVTRASFTRLSQLIDVYRCVMQLPTSWHQSGAVPRVASSNHRRQTTLTYSNSLARRWNLSQ